MNSDKYKYQIVDSKPNTAVIEFGTDVSGGSDALVFTSVLQELSQKSVKIVVLNLESVEVMNSSGLGMLVAGLSTLKKHNMNLVLCKPPVKVQNLLTMTHLDKVFNVSASIEDALRIHR